MRAKTFITSTGFPVTLRLPNATPVH